VSPPRGGQHRPAVLATTVAHLQDLARTGEAAWDPEWVGALGHSIGGHATLAAGEARLDTVAFANRCDGGDEDAAWLCNVPAPKLDAIDTKGSDHG